MANRSALPAPTEPAPVSDATLRRFAGYHMKRAFNVVQADLTQTLRPFRLRMLTYSALTLIVDNPGLRQSQLAEALAIERPNLVLIVDQLEARDLIQRDRDPSDRRAHALIPTRAGQRLCDRALVAVSKHEERLFGFLGGQERAVLLRALQQVETGSKGDNE